MDGPRLGTNVWWYSSEAANAAARNRAVAAHRTFQPCAGGPHGAEEQHAEDEILEHVSALANQEMQKLEGFGAGAWQHPVQNRDDDASGVLFGK